MKEVKKHLSAAYNQMRALVVSQDNVKRVALAEQEIENAFRRIEDLEKQKEEQADGQTD